MSQAFSARAAIADVPAQIDLLPGWRGGAGEHVAALRVQLDPGWKTYWRSPGASGMPPNIDFSESSNLSAMQVYWPRPSLFEDYGGTVIGYSDELILPIAFSVSGAGEARLKGRVEIGLCNKICLSHSVSFDAVLPAQSEPVPAIEAAMAQVPPVLHQAMECVFDQPGKIGVNVPEIADDTIAILELDGAILGLSERVEISNFTQIIAPIYGETILERSNVRLTVMDQEGGIVDYQGCN